MKRKASLLTVAVVVLAFASAGAAWASPPSPAKGQGLVKRVSGQEALDASRIPGANTEVAAGLTPGQAVGLTPIPAGHGPDPAGLAPVTADATTLATASAICWSDFNLWTEWGTYPAQQRVSEHRYWCGYYGGAQTYRTSSVHLGVTLCSSSGGYVERQLGGNGYLLTDVLTGGAFQCPAWNPFVTFDRWQTWRCDTYARCFWWNASSSWNARAATYQYVG